MTTATAPAPQATPAPQTAPTKTGSATKGLIGAAAVLGLGPMLLILSAIVLFTGAVATNYANQAYSVNGVSDFALKDIPPNYLALYQRAGEATGVDWAVLAGIGWKETNHGRLQAPGVTSGANADPGCCGGPMQFYFMASPVPSGRGPAVVAQGRVRVGQSSPQTWGMYGTDGNGDGWKDVWDPADAIPAAAAYLKASGAPADYQKAIFAYNHAQWYVDAVLERAEKYRGSKTTVIGGGGPVADLPPAEADGDRLSRLVTAMNQLEAAKVPYCYGGGHGTGNPVRPTAGQYCWGGNPLRKQTGTGAVGLDCSSSTTWLLQRAGYTLTTLTSGGFMSWGKPGPGRSVTIWTNPVHVYLEVKLNGRSYYFGTSTENYRHGPGWHSPRSGAGFVARHPEGL